jgi:hypothetical protein
MRGSNDPISTDTMYKRAEELGEDESRGLHGDGKEHDVPGSHGNGAIPHAESRRNAYTLRGRGRRHRLT